MTPPLTEFDPAYVKRRADIVERIFKLKSGKQLSYFTEGSVEDPAFLCIPGAGNGKCIYIMPEPLKGVFLIAVDMMGHGKSSILDSDLDYREVVAGYAELLDDLKVDKFYVGGHSTGGVHSMQVAAGLPDRVLGCLVCSSPCNMLDPSLTAEWDKKLNENGARRKLMLFAWTGNSCKKACLKYAMKGSKYHPDQSKDPGFVGRAPRADGDEGSYYAFMNYFYSDLTCEAIKTDRFWVSKMLEAEMIGVNGKWGTWYTAKALMGTVWPYNLADIKCRCHLYCERFGDCPAPYTERNHSLIPGSEMVVFDQHNHVSIAMEFEKMLHGIMRGEIVKEGFK
jgi:pimeloyl-ACP methyl ester carboxylesterase